MRKIIFFLLALAVFQTKATAAPYEVDARRDVFVDVYLAVNVKGKVLLSVSSIDGSDPCIKVWWIKWPLGNIGSLPDVCGQATIEIPTLPNIAAKLRAQALGGDVKISVSDDIAPVISIGTSQ